MRTRWRSRKIRGPVASSFMSLAVNILFATGFVCSLSCVESRSVESHRYASGPDETTPPPFPTEFGRWVRERVGPVVFPEGSSKTWDDVIGLAGDLGARAVKTWVRSDTPGDALARLQTEPYRALIRRFEVVHFNISPVYIVGNYQAGAIDAASLRGIQEEWRDITRMLCREWPSPDRIFLLGVGGELNVYLGTKDAYPDFPVAEYVNACHAGKEAALGETDPAHRPRVFSVAEFQGDKEYDLFARQWAPLFNTDLISLSYYTFYRSLADALALLRPCVKAVGPFGAHRLMLGEYGPSLESCNWNQAEHARWHDAILQEAFKEHLQFAFFYEIADHEAVIKTGSHDGLVTWAPEAVHRLAWDYYQRLYQGKGVELPQGDTYEIRLPQPPAESGTPGCNLTIVELKSPSAQPRPGDTIAFTAKIKNTGSLRSQDSTVNFYVDDRLVAWVWFPALDVGQEIELETTQQDPRFHWTARKGSHRITAVVDPLDRNRETREEDNAKILHFDVGVPRSK